MTPPNPPAGSSLADLLREARAAARIGEADEAERLYRQIVDRSPANVEAWLGLGSVLTDPAEKAACFRQVLEVDPGNEDAAASLARLEATLPAAEPATLYCAFHPQVPTVLRCSQCGRPICVHCAQIYPVGQLCPICVRGRKPAYYQPGVLQLVAAGGATLLGAALAGLLASFVLPTFFGLIAAFLGGPAVGSLLARLALWAGRKRRGPAVQVTAGLCTVVGSFLGTMVFLPVFLLGTINLMIFFLYVGLAVGSVVAWLR